MPTIFKNRFTRKAPKYNTELLENREQPGEPFKAAVKCIRIVPYLLLVLCILMTEVAAASGPAVMQASKEPQTKKYIKYVEFNVPYNALDKALKLDISHHGEGKPLSWIEILAYLASKYGGDFKRYKSTDMDTLVKKIDSGDTISNLAQNSKLYSYYLEAYTAILGGFVGEYSVQVPSPDNPNEKIWQTKYGLKVFSPIAKGYPFQHFEDFGTQRTYGYHRQHLGHDLMAQTGTPVIAVESGVVEAMGWNQYGGWRIGIRSFDGKRYYYYAHLRQNRPYHVDLCQGKIVKAGDVIGYVGRTGYSAHENVSNIEVSHLHFGLQLIFDESQKEGVNQIWIDLYDTTLLLQKNRSEVYKAAETKEYYRKYDYKDEQTE